MDQTLLLILVGIIGFFGVFWLLQKPYLGIAFTVASLPILDLLPDIPYFSSVVPMVGGLTLIAYFINKRKGPRGPVFKFSNLHILALLFVLWVFISNPQAAVLGAGRNWLLTLFQLWVLLYLAGELLDTAQKQQAVMLVFSIFAIISAFYAVQSGSIGETFDTSVRAEGFVDNANAAARYFVVAMIFLTFFRSQTENPFLKFFALLGILITYLGVFYTVSRTGILLLFGAQGLILLFQTRGRQRIGIILVFLIGLVLLWFLADTIFDIISTILPIIINREDTFGLRVNLWHSAWLMFLDHPLRGVGIGRYIEELGPYIYTLEGPRRWNAITHNTYLQVLSETGIVGFALFMSMVGISLKNFFRKDIRLNSPEMALRTTWLIAFIVMLMGGITKSDHADKFSWMVMGLSVYFAAGSQTQEVPAKASSPSKPETMQRTSYPS
jgi:O-antigen ligase